MLKQNQDIFITDLEERIDAIRHRLWTANPAEPKRDGEGKIVEWGQSTFNIFEGKPLPNYDGKRLQGMRADKGKVIQNSPPSIKNSYANLGMMKTNPPPVGRVASSSNANPDFQQM